MVADGRNYVLIRHIMFELNAIVGVVHTQTTRHPQRPPDVHDVDRRLKLVLDVQG
jgi:hypothetical protein